jgi:threonine/homoserine/homoserine lactone efflux protein
VRSSAGTASTPTSGSSQFEANFRQSLAVCLTNPKAILFYFAFFPLFLAEHSTPFTQAVMIAHVSVIGLIYQTGLVLAGQAVRRACARYSWTGRWGRRLAGVTLIGFGLKLAFNRR